MHFTSQKLEYDFRFTEKYVLMSRCVSVYL